MMFIFVAIFLFIDYVSYSVVEELKKVNGILVPPTVLNVNIEATGFLDYFLRYQLITIIIGIVAFIIVFVKFQDLDPLDLRISGKVVLLDTCIYTLSAAYAP